MKKIKNIDKLTDIKSVVFYDSSGSLIKTLHSGKSNKVLLDNHSQYNFSYLFEKDKYNGNFIVNDLDTYSKSLLGFGEEGITKIEKVLFPTLISEQNDDDTDTTIDYDYFGYLLIDSSKFFLLDILPDTKYIVLSNLFLKDTVPTSIDKEDEDTINSESCYIVLNNSSTFRRILSIYLSSNSDPKINLMYQLFLNDNKNPFRNAHKIYLRNDDYYKESTDIDIISENRYSPEKIYNLDKSSGTILSNSIKNEELLIFNRKKNISDNLVNQFDKHVRYNKNDQVIIKNHKNEDEVWISLVDNNLGNIPNYSSLWSKETTLNNIRLNRLYLSLSCNNIERIGKVYNNFAKLNKSGYIILNDDNLIFEITLEDGFKLSEEGCLILDSEKLEDFTIENNPSNINNKSITISTSNLIDKYTLTCQVIPEMYKLSVSVNDNNGFVLYEGDNEVISTDGGYNVFNQDTIKIIPNNGKILNSIQLNSGNCIINDNIITILPQANENSVINLVLNIINKLCNIFIDNDIRIISDCDKSFSKPQEEVITIRFYTDEENKELYVEDLNTYTYNSREDKITREGRDDVINVSNNEFTISYYINNNITDNIKEKHYRINNINYQIDEINIEDFMLARYRINSNLIVTVDFRNEKIIEINDNTVDQDLVIGSDGSITITVDGTNYVFNIDNEANLSTIINDVEVVIVPETIFTIDGIIYTIDWSKNKINDTINIEEGNYFYLNNIKYYINNYWPKYYIYTIANTIETESLGNSTYKFELNAGITEKTSDGIYNYIVKIDKDETVIKLKVKE